MKITREGFEWLEGRVEGMYGTFDVPLLSFG